LSAAETLSVAPDLPMVHFALDYARRGWSVFPCHPANKRPYINGGHNSATTDPEKIRQWWTKWPRAMIGGPMGSRTGVWAIDCDPPKKEGDADGRVAWAGLVKKNGTLPATHTEDTPRGGQHILFAWDPKRPVTNSPGALKGQSIDVRGEGGYIIMAPSVSADGRCYGVVEPLDFFHFATAPDWLYELVLPPQGPATPATVFSLPTAQNKPSLFPPNEFFRKVNSLAFDRLESWVPAIFPHARLEKGTGAWRISSRDLGRDLQEDLSISPLGAKDWGVWDIGDPKAGRRSAIDIVIEHGGKRDAAEAALWLCDRCGVDPASLGWRQQEEKAGDRQEKKTSAKRCKKLKATPYVWRDPADIPRREFLYGKHFIRKFISAKFGNGGVGKSSLALTEAIAMATGRPLLGIKPNERCRVWYWNGEDPRDETDRRIAAICLRFGLKQSDLEGWLFVDSGREQKIIIAVQNPKTGAVIAEPVANEMVETILANSIDVVIIDPFVSCHRVIENDNPAMDLVAKKWSEIADQTNSAIELLHHVKKTGGQDASVEDGRGASALLAAVRSAEVLNKMTEIEEEKAGVANRKLFFKVENGKANLAPPPEGKTWYQIVSVPLGNGNDGGDSVGVATSWKWPDPLDGVTGRDFELAAGAIRAGRWRESSQAKAWVGKPIAQALNLNLENKADRAKVAGLIKIWIQAGSLVVVEDLDEMRREPKKFVRVANED